MSKTATQQDDDEASSSSTLLRRFPYLQRSSTRHKKIIAVVFPILLIICILMIAQFFVIKMSFVAMPDTTSDGAMSAFSSWQDEEDRPGSTTTMKRKATAVLDDSIHHQQQLSDHRVPTTLPSITNSTTTTAVAVTTATTETVAQHDAIQKSPQQQQQQQQGNVRLEFLHIPKVGGTMIEMLALEKGIPWGACHFEFPWRKKPKNILRKCPRPLTKPGIQSGHRNLWHYTLQDLYADPRHTLTNDPYDNVAVTSVNHSHYDATKLNPTKKFFAVIRHPYTWFLSLYTMNVKRKESLDEYVQNGLKSSSFLQPRHDYYFCQSEFIYNTTQAKIAIQKDDDANYSSLRSRRQQPEKFVLSQVAARLVDRDHVLRLENIAKEFDGLVNGHYGYNMTIPSKERKVNAANKGRVKKRENQRYSKETLRLIHSYCYNDFIEGSYKMIDLDLLHGNATVDFKSMI